MRVSHGFAVPRLESGGHDGLVEVWSVCVGGAGGVESVREDDRAPCWCIFARDARPPFAVIDWRHCLMRAPHRGPHADADRSPITAGEASQQRSRWGVWVVLPPPHEALPAATGASAAAAASSPCSPARVRGATDSRCRRRHQDACRVTSAAAPRPLRRARGVEWRTTSALRPTSRASRQWSP